MQPDFHAGQITAWSGSVGAIPTGWFLCDGTNGTPDLRDNFVVGAASSYAPGASAGALVHNHALTTDGHAHTVPIGTDLANTPATEDTNYWSATDFAVTDDRTNLPTYFALAYIMFGG